MAENPFFCYSWAMKRIIFRKLRHWKHSKSRKPLILQGARQVGKTYIVKAFAKAEFTSCTYVNFEQDKRAREIFNQDLHPDRIIKALELHLNMQINADDTLIFFDEIQECPNALNSLKYFYEQAANYFIIAAGSLLGVKLANSKGFPVGKVNFLTLYPMTFCEFLQASDRTALANYLMELETIEPIDPAVHHDLCDLLKDYMYVGGMPEAVKSYADNEDLNSVRQVQNEILKAYTLDFAKHAPENQIMRISQVWESLPQQLAKENKKFQFAIIKSGSRLRDYEIALQWLRDAGLIYTSYNINTPKLPLKAYLSNNAFKLYCLDVGLLGALAGLFPQIILEQNRLFTEFKGAFTENLAAQLLTYNDNPQLYYWTSGNTAEVDFIVPHQDHIIPLEVKAGLSSKKKSLLRYQEQYQPEVICRANLNNLKQEKTLINYPLYLLERFPIL